jgi:hypothetical protein
MVPRNASQYYVVRTLSILFTVKTSIRAYDFIQQFLYFIQQFLYSKRNETQINLLNAELKPICHLLALLGAHHILHISRIRVKNQCCPIPCLVWFVYLFIYRCSHCMASMADGWLQIWSIGAIIIGENRSTQRQAPLNNTLSITSPTQNTVVSNPDLRGQKPATNRLSYDTVCSGALQSSWQVQNTQAECWEVIGYRSGVADVNVPGYNARSRGNRFPTFRDTAVTSSSRVDISKKNPADIFTNQFFYIHLHEHVLTFPSLLRISKNSPHTFFSRHKNLYNLCHVTTTDAYLLTATGASRRPIFMISITEGLEWKSHSLIINLLSSWDYFVIARPVLK